MNKYTVGVDVGGTNVRIGLLEPDGTLSGIVRLPRRDALPDDNPTLLCKFISDYIASRGVEVAAVGVGIPGTLDRNCINTLKVPNIPCLDGLPLGQILTDSLQIPVFLENDTVMLLAGDISRLAIDSSGLLVGVYIGTGLGSAVFYNGKPLKGKNGLNELGHIPLSGRTEKCSCGNTGCAENYVSGRWLEALRREKYPDVHISDMFTALSGSAELDSFIDTLACVLATVYNLLDPDVLVLSGGVVSMKDFPLTALEEAVRRRTMKPQPSQGLCLTVSTESGETGVLGAAIYAAQSI